MNELRRLLPGETAFGWLALAFSLFLFYHSYKIAGFSSLSSSGGTPLAASGLMIVSSVIVILRNRKSPSVGTATAAEAARRFHDEILPFHPLIAYVFVIFAYMLLLEPLGFNLTSFLFLCVSFYYLYRQGGLWLAVWLSAVAVIVVYILFQLIFQVTLPDGDWLAPVYRAIGR
ncbi:tripartite tricarboxylate transporter TctB family protein [Xanthobacteraceae bacterium Astr-EGSB]|uniref:tripartite tricarboxylate transporter TctB family protein n=1 Tax=Astrobacterium formosum TaxID=3069710 RepID=UPI0027B45D34|nr:tripartite tricarboxylate transporter TctB family protein [Xanthobacteraceae bacterium Astr-EGSB]